MTDDPDAGTFYTGALRGIHHRIHYILLRLVERDHQTVHDAQVPSVQDLPEYARQHPGDQLLSRIGTAGDRRSTALFQETQEPVRENTLAGKRHAVCALADVPQVILLLAAHYGRHMQQHLVFTSICSYIVIAQVDADGQRHAYLLLNKQAENGGVLWIKVCRAPSSLPGSRHISACFSAEGPDPYRRSP